MALVPTHCMFGCAAPRYWRLAQLDGITARHTMIQRLCIPATTCKLMRKDSLPPSCTVPLNSTRLLAPTAPLCTTAANATGAMAHPRCHSPPLLPTLLPLPTTAATAGTAAQRGRKLLQGTPPVVVNELVAENTGVATDLVDAATSDANTKKTAADAYKNAATEAKKDNTGKKKKALVANTVDALQVAASMPDGSTPAPDGTTINPAVKDLAGTLGTAMTTQGAEGEAAKQTVAEAIGSAAASGEDGKNQAAAEVTAAAICVGGQTATAFGSAVATVVAKDPKTLCTTVNVAVATAASVCAEQLKMALSSSFAQSFKACPPDPDAIRKAALAGINLTGLRAGAGGPAGAPRPSPRLTPAAQAALDRANARG